jgi:hypothetical protein
VGVVEMLMAVAVGLAVLEQERGYPLLLVLITRLQLVPVEQAAVLLAAITAFLVVTLYSARLPLLAAATEVAVLVR